MPEQMTDLRKAAEMALEALSEYTEVVTSGTDPTKWDEVVDGGGPAREAIEALRQALAMERFSEVSQEIEEALKQEPVAWLYQTAYGDKFIHKKEQAAFHQPNGIFTPLYTAPPKREWVGLTDREITKIGNLDWDSAYVGIWYDFAKGIEAKLKEKNT
jgi:hypothetical protein